MWTRAVRRQEHLHVNVQVWRVKAIQRVVKVMLTKLRTRLADFLAVIGDSWDLDQKRNGEELTLMSLMVFGIKLLETWCMNSQKLSVAHTHPFLATTTTNTTITQQQDSNQHAKGWRFVVTSPWMWLHPRGSRRGHPRYTGASTEAVDGPTAQDQKTTTRPRLPWYALVTNRNHSSKVPCFQCPWKMGITKQRRKKEDYSFQR